MSVGSYKEEVQKAIETSGGSGVQIELSFIDHWHDRPAFLDVLAERVKRAKARLPEEIRARAPLSSIRRIACPPRILEWNDPYPRHLEETARGVSERAGVGSWHVAWQSEGATSVPWLKPTLEETIERLASEGGRAVIICPAGFVADHLEVLYDIDIEAKAEAEKLGLALVRTDSLNEIPTLSRHWPK